MNPRSQEEPIVAAENYVENDQSSRGFLDEIQSERASPASLTDSVSEGLGENSSVRDDLEKDFNSSSEQSDISFLNGRFGQQNEFEGGSLMPNSSDRMEPYHYDSRHHELREINVQHAEVPSAWSERPDFASSPTVSSALFQVGGINNSPNFPLTDSKMPLKQNGAGHSNGFPRLVEKGGKKWLVVDARKIFVRADQAPASMQLAGVSQDTKELDVPSHGESTSASEVFFMHETSTSITLGHCFYTYIPMPKGMVAPERVEALFVPGVR